MKSSASQSFGAGYVEIKRNYREKQSRRLEVGKDLGRYVITVGVRKDI